MQFRSDEIYEQKLTLTSWSDVIYRNYTECGIDNTGIPAHKQMTLEGSPRPSHRYLRVVEPGSYPALRLMCAVNGGHESYIRIFEQKCFHCVKEACGTFR